MIDSFVSKWGSTGQTVLHFKTVYYNKVSLLFIQPSFFLFTEKQNEIIIVLVDDLN